MSKIFAKEARYMSEIISKEKTHEAAIQEQAKIYLDRAFWFIKIAAESGKDHAYYGLCKYNLRANNKDLSPSDCLCAWGEALKLLETKYGYNIEISFYDWDFMTCMITW